MTDEPEPLIGYLIDGEPICVRCAQEIKHSSGVPVWWDGHVQTLTDSDLITKQWTLRLGTLVCKCGKVLALGSPDQLGDPDE